EPRRVRTETHGPRYGPAQEIRLVQDPVLDAEVRRIPARARGEVVRRDDDDEIAESEERLVRTAGDRGHAVRIPGARGVVRRGHFEEDAPGRDICDGGEPAAACGVEVDLRIADEVRRRHAEERGQREGLHLDALFRRNPAQDVHHLDDVAWSRSDLDIGRGEAVGVRSVRAEVQAFEGEDGYGRVWLGSHGRGLDGTSPTAPGLVCGVDPRSEAPQASRMSKLPHSGAPVASRRRYNSYRSRDGTDSFSTSIARRKISSIRPLAYTSRSNPRSRSYLISGAVCLSYVSIRLRTTS